MFSNITNEVLNKFCLDSNKKKNLKNNVLIHLKAGLKRHEGYHKKIGNYKKLHQINPSALISCMIKIRDILW